MDRFEIFDHLRKLCVTDLTRDETYQLRLLLKKILLEEILKLDSENKVFSDHLSKINKLITFDSKGYSCCLVGCRFHAQRHREYVTHIKTTHYRASNVKCNFKHTCPRSFSSIENLILHIKDEHCKTSAPSINIPAVIAVVCKCNLVICGSRHFTNLKDLLTHMNTVHHKDARSCVFKNCEQKFGAFSTSRHHFRIKHSNRGELKTVHLLDDPNTQSAESAMTTFVDANDDPDYSEVDMQDYDLFDIDAIENPEPDLSDETEDYFMMYYADFMNRLAHDKFIPYSTVQDIAEEYYKNSKKSQEICEKKLRESLREVENFSCVEVDKIVKDVIEDDFFIKAQEQLNTQYKRTKFVKEKMQYISPVEIVLNKSEVEKGLPKDVVHYCPLDSALKNLLEDRSLSKLLEQEKQRPPKSSNKIEDILDGSVIKNTVFFQENPEALAFIFYSDGLELKNPLGAARGTYKVVQVFYTLANIPKSQRSQVDRIQLAMIYKEKLTKKYSYGVIYRKLIEDLKKLEAGIEINTPEPRVVKAGLLLHSADNLGKGS